MVETRGIARRSLALLAALAATASLAATPPAPAASSAPATTAQRHPIEQFAALPLLSRVSLSPDGTRIAALMNDGDRTVLITRAIDGNPVRALLSTDNQKFHFGWLRWANNDRLLVSLRFASRRYFVGTVETRLLSVPVAGGSPTNLVHAMPRAGSLTVQTQQIQDQVVDWLRDDEQHILMALGEDGIPLPGVYKVNVETGRRQMVKAPERDVYNWITDVQNRVRVGMRGIGGETEVRASDPDGKNWRTLWKFDRREDGVWPIGFGLDPQELFVRGHHEGRLAVFSVRLDDPALTKKLHHANPRHDVYAGLFRSPRTGEVLGLHGTADGDDSDDDETALWEPAWRAQVQAIDQALPRRSNRMIGLSRDEQRYLIHSSGNGLPGQYYVGNRQDGSLALLGDTYPELSTRQLAGKHRVTIPSRDGLTLNAYLTLPAGRQFGTPGPALPMVLLPHGGPASADNTDFDPWTEFLADRGLAVLQVNFRGSTGYGHAFLNAGLKRWGLEMQDDLTDAVAWAIEGGVADAKRVCIVGASYGGYAALMGTVKTPGLYRCAVSLAGVTHLPDLVVHAQDYVGGREQMERMIGRIWGDRERLRATSPALQAAQIRTPILLLHGTVDRSVPIEQAESMASALKRAGTPFRYVELEGGDHHLSRQSHRLQFFRELEAFLDEHLAPGTPPTQQATR